MRILSIAAVTLLGSGLSVATAQQLELLSNTKVPTQKVTKHDQKGNSNLGSSTTTKVASQAQLLGTPTAPGNQSFVAGGSDTCATATPIAGPGPFLGDNIGATTDGPANCGLMAADVWYDYMAGATGVHTFDMCASGYDTVITVYDTAACTGAMLACNDDACPGFRSSTTAALTSGNVYKIQIGGFNGSTGTYSLSINPPGPGCPCAGAPPEGEAGCGIPIDTFNGGCNSSPNVYSLIAVGGTVCGTAAYDGTTRDTDWYQFTLGVPTTVTWTVTAEYPVATGIIDNLCPPVTIYDFDNGAACTATSSTAFLAAGTYVAFTAPQFAGTFPCGTNDSYNGALTSGGGGCPGPANNCCATPTTVVGNGPFAWDNNAATTDGPASSCGILTLDVWYTWNATCTGTATFSLCVGGLNPDTVIDVYNGVGCPAAGTSIACDDDTCSSPAFGTSRCTFSCTAGQDYTLRIGSYSGGPTGSGMFEVTCVPTAPAGPCDVFDDGTTETSVGTNNPTHDILWLHRQGDVGITTVVKSISTAWGSVPFGGGPPNGTPARVGIWQDTSGTPNGAVLLQEVSIPGGVAGTNTDVLQTVDLAPYVYVTGKYWIGASCAGGTFQAPLDTTNPPGAGRSWIVGSTVGPIVYANLSGEEIPPLDEDNVAPGVWLLRGNCKDLPITYFCYGDANSPAPCPCGNPPNGPAGCGHGDIGSPHNGAILTAAGNPSLLADNSPTGSVSLTVNDLRPSTLVLVFQGTLEIAPVANGNGRRCVGTGPGLHRIFKIARPTPGPISETVPSGSNPYLVPSNTSISNASILKGDFITPGSRAYYVAYRDPRNDCPGAISTFNLSNAVNIVWSP